MSSCINLNSPLTRRSWLALAGATLTGCGGGEGSSTASAPGTGGTGQYAMVYSQGSITGFGSVIVNGIKFDDSLAHVQLDGITAASADLRLGMVAGIQGERGVGATLGTASSIEVWSVAQGLITQGFEVGSGEFKLAGMAVQTDNATVFDGIPSAAQLSSGLRVAVWGLQAGADGAHWKATRVALVSSATGVSTGVIRVKESQPVLNDWVLTGSAASGLLPGQWVRVQGTVSEDRRSLSVDSVKLLAAGLAAQAQGTIEMEGFVTSTPANGRFMLGSIEVDASSTTYSPAGAQIILGARVEVYGTWQSGVLKASQVELEDEHTLHAVEIEARIAQFSSLANFVVRGQRCNATSARISHGTAADLKVGVKVKVKGAKTGGDVLMVTELEFD